MILDAESLADGTRLAADVCILGAGAAGITLARELEGTGLTVVVLESGAETLEPDIQDLARGARTEVDALNGAVVREGERLGVPTPVNRRLWQDVLKLEARA